MNFKLPLVRLNLPQSIRASHIKANQLYNCYTLYLTFSWLPDNALFIGITTRHLLKKLENEGDITPAQVSKFYHAVCEFYTTAVEYALKNLKLKDEVLQNAHFLNFLTRETSLFSEVEFFVTRYNN